MYILTLLWQLIFSGSESTEVIWLDWTRSIIAHIDRNDGLTEDTTRRKLADLRNCVSTKTQVVDLNINKSLSIYSYHF